MTYLSRKTAFKGSSLSFACATLLVAETACAEPTKDASRELGALARTTAPAETPLPERDAHLHLFGNASVGKGLRFNNPYRLSTVLGDSPESLSLSATYLDLGLGLTFPQDSRLEHGAVVHVSIAVEGIPQEVVSVSYLALGRALRRTFLYGRFGLPVVVEPDLTGGIELGAGASWLALAGLGFNAELVGSFFYGASTPESSVSYIPMLSLQLGMWVDYEVLP